MKQTKEEITTDLERVGERVAREDRRAQVPQQ
jgi:hypothetical protein